MHSGKYYSLHYKHQVVTEAPKVEVTTTSTGGSLDIDALLAKYKYSSSSYTPAVTTTDYQVAKRTSVSRSIVDYLIIKLITQ